MMAYEEILQRIIFENDFGSEDFVDGKTAEVLAKSLANRDEFLNRLDDIIAKEVEKELKLQFKELF